MQKLTQFLILPFVLSFLVACGGGSSSGNSDTSSPDPNTGSNTVDTKTITIDVKAADGSDIGENVSIDISGTEVTDTNQNVINSITFPATKTVQAKIGSNDSVDLKLLAKATGFVDSGLTVQLIPQQSDYTATIFLVENITGSSMPGIYTQVDAISNVENAVAQNEIVLTLEESASTPNLVITIPQNTQFNDVNGNPITPNSSTLVRYDPLEQDVLDAYPGGLNVMADVNGTMEQVNFKSAGFASIVLKDAANNKVKRFDRDITIAMQFKIGTTNENGVVAQVGDIIPIWSYDEDEGTWRYERDGTIQDLNTSDGLYDVTYQTNHLTFYNLDWNIPSANLCNPEIDVLDGNGSPQTNRYSVNFLMPAFNINDTFDYLGDGLIRLNGSPTMPTEWELVFTNPSTNEEVARYSSSRSICDNHTATVAEEVADNVKVYNVTVVATNGSGCDFTTATGNYTITDDTQISGTVDGLNVVGTRNSSTGQVSGGFAQTGGISVASFGGTMNDTQGSGTWMQTDGTCNGTWSGVLAP